MYVLIFASFSCCAIGQLELVRKEERTEKVSNFMLFILPGPNFGIAASLSMRREGGDIVGT
jgi:hypothetical protein